MKNRGWNLAILTACVLIVSTACAPEEKRTADNTTAATTVITTARTTGTPTTITAPSLSGLQISSPTGEKPDAVVLKQLTDLCAGHKDSVSIYYKDLETGYTVTYRPTADYQTASVIKAPYVKYLLQSGVDRTEKLSITSKQGGGSFVDKYAIGTEFTVEQLMEYAVRYSDNTAYYTLNKRFGFSGFMDYTASIGIVTRLPLVFPKPRFGYLSALDAGLYFEDIAKYIDEGSPEARLLFYWMTNTSECRQLPDAYTLADLSDMSALESNWANRCKGYTVAHKYGEQGNQAYHDSAIVWRDHPYVLAVLSTLEPYAESSLEVFHGIAHSIDALQTGWYD